MGKILQCLGILNELIVMVVDCGVKERLVEICNVFGGWGVQIVVSGCRVI